MSHEAHRHKWERVGWLRDVLAWTCMCGSAVSVHPDVIWYSPRKPTEHAWMWRRVRLEAAAQRIREKAACHM